MKEKSVHDLLSNHFRYHSFTASFALCLCKEYQFATGGKLNHAQIIYLQLGTFSLNYVKPNIPRCEVAMQTSKARFTTLTI